MLKYTDITGQRFGKLVAIELSEILPNRSIIWKCLCDCGKEKYVTYGNLLYYTRSCGCTRVKDITGKRFGKLTVVSLTTKRGKGDSAIWKCRCDCGKECFKSTQLLNSGTKSCGCLVEGIDITNKRFGKLIAIKPTKKRYGRSIMWECTCDCGNTAMFSVSQLVGGINKSCGCLKSSCRSKSGYKGVYWVKRYQKWLSQIEINNKTFYLGYYLDIEDAIQARKDAETKSYEEFIEWNKIRKSK